jgi:hypothetical protein
LVEGLVQVIHQDKGDYNICGLHGGSPEGECGNLTLYQLEMAMVHLLVLGLWGGRTPCAPTEATPAALPYALSSIPIGITDRTPGRQTRNYGYGVARFILDEAIRLVFGEVVISLDSSLLEQWIGTLALLLFLVPVVACVAGVLPGMGIGAFTGMLIRCTLHL